MVCTPPEILIHLKPANLVKDLDLSAILFYKIIMSTKTLSILYYTNRSDPPSATDSVGHVSLKLSDFVFKEPPLKTVCDCENCSIERRMRKSAIAKGRPEKEKGHPICNLEAMMYMKKRLEKNKDKYNPFEFRFNEEVLKFAIAVFEQESKERFEWVLKNCEANIQARKEMEEMQQLSKASVIQPKKANRKAGEKRQSPSPVAKVQPSLAGKKRRSPPRNAKSVYKSQQKTSLVDKDTIRIDIS